MKKFTLITALILLFAATQVLAGGESVSYVKTNGKVYFGQDLKRGLFNTKIISTDGTVLRIPNTKVVAYMHDSKLFEYLPVVCEDNDTICFAMMEYITSRSGLKLYRYSCYDNKDTTYGYFVFKDNKFYLSITKENAASTLPFFGIAAI